MLVRAVTLKTKAIIKRMPPIPFLPLFILVNSFPHECRQANRHRLVSAMAFANFICVKSAASSSGQSANRCAFAATGNAADHRAASRAHRGRQLVSVLLPECAMGSAVAVIE